MAGYPHHICRCHQSGTSTGTSWTSAKGSAKPWTNFFWSKEKNSLFTKTFLSEALQLSYLCRGTGVISVPSLPHSSWRWQLPHCCSGCSLCCDFTWTPWIADSYYDTQRRKMYHNNFKAHVVQWVRQGVNRRGRSLNTDNMMLIWASYYFIFSLSQILLLWWTRWFLLHFYSLAPQSSSDDSLKWKKIQAT